MERYEREIHVDLEARVRPMRSKLGGVVGRLADDQGSRARVVTAPESQGAEREEAAPPATGAEHEPTF